MKITSFNPLISTKDAEPVIRLFEELGFEKSHQPSGVSGPGNEFEAVRMSDKNGFHIDINQSGSPLPKDVTTIRMNVNNLDEACRILTRHGFTNAQSGTETDTGSAKAVFMSSLTGFGIVVVEHVKHAENK